MSPWRPGGWARQSWTCSPAWSLPGDWTAAASSQCPWCVASLSQEGSGASSSPDMSYGYVIMWSQTGKVAPQTRKRIIFHPCSCQQRKTFLRFAEKVMTIFNQNINEKLSNLIRHRNWEALHYMLKVALCNKILVKFVFFRSEVPREWLCPA